MSRSAPDKLDLITAFTTFGDLLRYVRQQRHLTQRDLALTVGYSISQISRLEHNERLPDEMTLLAVFVPALGLEQEPETIACLLALAHRAHAGDESRPTPCKTNRKTPVHGPLPELPFFYGRTLELQQAERWIVDEHCRLLAVLGTGGIGKTAFVAKLATTVSDHFDQIIWSSLLNAPPFAEMLHEWLNQLAKPLLMELPTRLDEQLKGLLNCLQNQRCLLILDNLESILQTGEAAGAYRPGYEAYGQLLQQVSLLAHRSCLLLTSRERPQPVGRLERDTTVVHTLVLPGLSTADAHGLLAKQGLVASATLEAALVRRYSGNPLALLLVAETVQELFGGDLADFLGDTLSEDETITNTPIFDDMRRVLDQQWARLSALEQELITWLAVLRQPVTAHELFAQIHAPPPRHVLVSALRTLERRTLLEHQRQSLTLQNVITEYITEQLIEQVCHEIATEQLQRLRQVALTQATTAEYLQQSQNRVILQPLAERLLKQFGRKEVCQKLQRLLEQLRTEAIEQQGYAGGNLLNLWLLLGLELSEMDLSGLAIWQADLRLATLHNTNLAGADLRATRLRDAFGAIYCVAFSPDGQFLATGASDFQIRVWHVVTQRCHAILEGHTQYIWGVAFAPQGQLLASCSLDGTIRLWDIAGRQCRQTLLGHTQGVRQIAFSPNGQTLVSASIDNTIRCWDVGTGTCSAVLRGHSGGVTCVAFSADGQWLVSGGDEAHLYLWRASTGSLVRLLMGHTSHITTVAFNAASSLIASGSADHTIRLWDVKRGALLATLTGHRDTVHSVAFCQDDQVLMSGAGDRTLRLWDTDSGQCVQVLGSHASAIWAVAASPRGHLLASAGDDKTIRLWHGQKRRLLSVLPGYTGTLGRLVFANAGALLAAAGADGNVHLWSIPTYHHQEMLVCGHGITRALDVHPGHNLLASSGDDGTVQLWDMGRKQRLVTLRGHAKTVRTVAFHPSGNLLASAGDEQIIHLWDIAHQTKVATWEAHQLSTWALAFHPYSPFLASAGMDPEVKLWHVESHQLVCTIPIGAGGHRTLAFSRDGNLLAIGSDDGGIHLWDMQARTMRQRLPWHQQMTYALAFHPDGGRLASASYDKTISLWRWQPGSRLPETPQVLTGHTNAVLAVAFHPHLPLLASCSMDKTLKIWDEANGVCLTTLHAPRPYEGMNITNVTGISLAQKAALLALGASDLASLPL